MTSNITIFKNIKETSTPFYRDINIVLERIREGACKNLVKKIRLEKKKEERNELKKLLPAICFPEHFQKEQTHLSMNIVVLFVWILMVIIKQKKC